MEEFEAVFYIDFIQGLEDPTIGMIALENFGNYKFIIFNFYKKFLIFKMQVLEKLMGMKYYLGHYSSRMKNLNKLLNKKQKMVNIIFIMNIIKMNFDFFFII